MKAVLKWFKVDTVFIQSIPQEVMYLNPYYLLIHPSVICQLHILFVVYQKILRELNLTEVGRNQMTAKRKLK